VLCTGYNSCSGLGYSHAGYAENKGNSYWNMYTGTNCTNYVAYRLITTNGLPNKRPAAGVGNARDWGTAMVSATNSTPAVGAIAWWGKTGNHVAYIEQVVSDNEIWVSESNWSGAFDWRKITRSGGGWPDGIIHFTPSAAPSLVNSAKPTVVGVPKVGTAVKASVGAWSPTPGSYAYQWLADGNPISGATAKTFTPKSSLVGRGLTVLVTAARSGYPTAATPSDPVAVAPGTLTTTARPTVSGTPKVGSRLTATPGSWSRKDVTLAYQWFSGDTPIVGATASSYVARSVDVDRALTAQVTASRAGYTSLDARSAATNRVAAGTLIRRSAPTVSGTARVGSRLTASPGTWSPKVTPSYQWYADGKAVPGATEQTFVPGARQRGAEIRVRVTARRPGYTSRSATSNSTRALAAGRISVTTKPVIVGEPVVGARLTVDPGAHTPTGAKARYQWLRDGKIVAGATGRNRTVSKNDLGHRLSATVTYKATGYSARTATTPALKRVRVAPKISVAARPAGTGNVTFSISVRAAGVSAPQGSITVRDGSGRTHTVKVVKGRATLTLDGQLPGVQTYRLTYRGTSTIAAGIKDKTVTIG